MMSGKKVNIASIDNFNIFKSGLHKILDFYKGKTIPLAMIDGIEKSLRQYANEFNSNYKEWRNGKIQTKFPEAYNYAKDCENYRDFCPDSLNKTKQQPPDFNWV
jgi:hypothetical protein